MKKKEGKAKRTGSWVSTPYPFMQSSNGDLGGEDVGGFPEKAGKRGGKQKDKKT